MTSHFLHSWGVFEAAVAVSPLLFAAIVFGLGHPRHEPPPRETWLDGEDTYGWTPNGLEYPPGLDSYMTPRDL